MKIWINYNWIKLVAIALLLGALLDLPYAYYQLMNWVVVGAAIVTALQAFKLNKFFVMWVFAFVGVIFNPIAPIYLNTIIWQIADVFTAVLFFIVIFLPVKFSTKK